MSLGKTVSAFIFAMAGFVLSCQAYATPMVYTFESDYGSINPLVDGMTTSEVVDFIGFDNSVHTTWQFIIDNEINLDGHYDVNYLSGAFFGDANYSYDSCMSSVPVQEGYVDCSGNGNFDTTPVATRVKIGYEFSRPELAAWDLGLGGLMGFNLIESYDHSISIWIEHEFTLTNIEPLAKVNEPYTLVLLSMGLLAIVIFAMRQNGDIRIIRNDVFKNEA